MKTIVALLTTTMLIAGASSAMADERQPPDDVLGFVGGMLMPFGFGGDFVSALIPADIGNGAVEAGARRVETGNRTVDVPSQHDFQLQGR